MYVYQDGKLIVVGCLILNDKKEVLLLKRVETQQWETPGGKLEVQDCMGEEPTKQELKQAARREIYEELGENVTHSKLFLLGHKDTTSHNGVEFRMYKFIAQMQEGNPIINEPQTFDELKFQSITALASLPLSNGTAAFVGLIEEYVSKEQSTQN